MTEQRHHSSIPLAAWQRPLGLDYPNAAIAAHDHGPIIDDGVFHGLPIGGMGSGAIGRNFRGDWSRWHLEVGKHVHRSVWPNQWSVFWQTASQQAAQVLCTTQPDTDELSSWNWNYPVGAGNYHALFPRAWFDYQHPDWPLELVQEQFSPVLAGNLKETSFPVGVFTWRVTNRGSETVRLGLMLTWEHTRAVEAAGLSLQRQHSAWNDGNTSGVTLAQTSDQALSSHNGTWALAVQAPESASVSQWTCWDVAQDAAALWQDFASDGQLADYPTSRSVATDQRSATAIAVTLELAPGASAVIPFSLAWDFPIVEFADESRWYKRYTRFWGTNGDQAQALAVASLTNADAWREAIEAWQNPILADDQRPLWYKSALFNELYYLVDGGTLWVDRAVGEPEPAADDVGLFSYLECYDYPFYGTLDVSFYSSWSILALWPELERGEILAFSKTVNDADDTVVTIVATQVPAIRKAAGALPHDLGAPKEQPLLKTNAYDFQDINNWKDLNLKYILRIYRDVTLWNDQAMLEATWDTIPTALEYVHQFDSDGDGLLDHSGADQTYDTWAMSGAASYSASLLICALEAAIRLAQRMGDHAQADAWSEWLAAARQSFETKLWNGTYFRYHTADTDLREVIMADQLVGQWYAGAIGLPAVAPREMIRSALQTVYRFNVMQYANGALGAVNGMHPDGTVDTSSNQASEVWSGTTYAIAAMMLQEGLDLEGWQTAWGAYNATYNELGLWFRTPEAWGIERTFRASMYMRPQSIWAIEHALAVRAKNA